MNGKYVDKRSDASPHTIDEPHKDKINYVNVTKDLVFDVEKPGSTNVDFDDLLPHIGNFGNYQIILFLLLAPYTLFYVFVYFTQIFITLVPNDYWCNVPELAELEVNDR